MTRENAVDGPRETPTRAAGRSRGGRACDGNGLCRPIRRTRGRSRRVPISTDHGSPARLGGHRRGTPRRGAAASATPGGGPSPAPNRTAQRPACLGGVVDQTSSTVLAVPSTRAGTGPAHPQPVFPRSTASSTACSTTVRPNRSTSTRNAAASDASARD